MSEKSRGAAFAEQQLLRHGWEHGETLTLSIASSCRCVTDPALSAGKGLGRAENGISEPIKVKVKCDKGGVSWSCVFWQSELLLWCGADPLCPQVGHREGEQFSFHWWDHVFNKASSSLQVQAHQVGSTLTVTSQTIEAVCNEFLWLRTESR